jgi:glycosyltransferase involved in cell wall biosynthesis
MYIIPYLSFRKRPKKWFKYAGNWTQQNPPFSYSFQRWWLKSNFQDSIVTVNGKWPGQQKHVISFENPCITTEELKEANAIAKNKNFDGKLTICFVGRVEEQKGVGRIIETFKLLPDVDVEKIIFVGDGPERKIFEEKAKGLKVKAIFMGGLSRFKLNDIYKESHIFCLPSTASEGFPKVIAEAAAYGCVPVVSDISSIGQFVKHNENGILLKDVAPEIIAKAFNEVLENRDHLKYLSTNVVDIATPFTYDHYNSRIKNEVLPQLK